jgi:glucose-6-phosphate 1-dehydrogenase
VVEVPTQRTSRPPEATTLLVLGADGDLTRRLLLPGLATLLAGERFDGREPPLLIGAGLGDFTTAEWRSRVRDAFATAGVRGPRLTEVARRTRYRQLDVTDRDALAGLLGECEGAPALYFALPPPVTRAACESLGGLDLPAGTSLALEKPFGTDAGSAASLNHLVTSLVPEERVYRVDHFLGRADVLNVLGVRFANRLLDPVWNHEHVESIEIVYDEDLALEGRAGYYDRAGALVDMVQSHLLQVMALLMMDPIAALDERSLRDAKNAVLRATHPAGRPASCSRRARYTQGRIGGRTVPAYTRESGVDPQRGTETLAELTVEVRNHRWSGVPVTLRSGKALGRPRKEAVVRLRPVPHLPDGLLGHETPDTVTIGFKPPRLAIHLDVSGEGDPFDLETSRLAASLDSGELTAYGEVLAGLLDGDPLLAVRGDSAEECWRIVDPVLAGWRDGEVPMDTYPAGSDGPTGW